MTMTVNGTPSTISYTPVGAGSVSRTVEDKMREAISVLDFIPVSEHAGIYNNTSGYDAAAAFQAAANTGRPIYAPGRRYCIGSPVDLTNCPGL